MEVTNSCPLACIHCSSSATPADNRHLAWADCARIIREASQLGVSEISFSGGEPLIWPFIAAAVKEASLTSGIRSSIYTSGNVPEPSEALEKLAESGLYRAVFSVYAADSGSHEAITRVRGSFLQTKNAIESAIRVGLEVELHFVPLASNYRNISAIADWSHQLGVSRISILRFVPQGRGQMLEDETLSPLQNLELGRLIAQLRKDGHNIRLGSAYNILLLNSDPHCLGAIDRIVVNADLRIAPCDAFKTIDPKDLGLSAEYSSLNTSSLEECWENSPLLAAVRNYVERPRGGACASCGSLEACIGGCPGQKAIHYGGLVENPDPLCLRRRVTSR